jgi:hypothetical protein
LLAECFSYAKQPSSILLGCGSFTTRSTGAAAWHHAAAAITLAWTPTEEAKRRRGIAGCLREIRPAGLPGARRRAVRGWDPAGIRPAPALPTRPPTRASAPRLVGGVDRRHRGGLTLRPEVARPPLAEREDEDGIAEMRDAQGATDQEPAERTAAVLGSLGSAVEAGGRLVGQLTEACACRPRRRWYGADTRARGPAAR